MPIYEYQDSILCRFRTKTAHSKTHIDISMHGAFTGLNARNIQRALRLPEDDTFVNVELILRREVDA